MWVGSGEGMENMADRTQLIGNSVTEMVTPYVKNVDTVHLRAEEGIR